MKYLTESPAAAELSEKCSGRPMASPRVKVGFRKTLVPSIGRQADSERSSVICRPRDPQYLNICFRAVECTLNVNRGANMSTVLVYCTLCTENSGKCIVGTLHLSVYCTVLYINLTAFPCNVVPTIHTYIESFTLLVNQSLYTRSTPAHLSASRLAATRAFYSTCV